MVERQLPQLQRFPVTKAVIYRNVDRTAWENGCCESFNGKLRNEYLKGEIFCGLTDARVTVEQWHIHDNTRRSRSALGYRPPAPVTIAPPPALDGSANMQ